MADGIKAFQFAAKKATSPKIAGKFEIDGEIYEVRRLKDSAISWLIHQTTDAGVNETISAVFDFTERALTADSAKRFEKRVLSKDDPENALTNEEIVEVFQHVLTILTSFPTGPSSDSPPSRRRTTSGSRATTAGRADAN